MDDRQRRFLMSGASGLVGQALTARLEAAGHRVVRLVRRKSDVGPDAVLWSPEKGELETSDLEGLDGVVHLAGENVAGGRWTAERRARIRDSRVQGTRTLVRALRRLEHKPGVLVSASAIGYYGDRGDERLPETATAGEGFLAEVCVAWEAEAQKAEELLERVVRLRIGVVLAREGGALEKMRLPFSLGLGGRIGTGRQYMPWITLNDLVRVFEHALFDVRYQGPINAVAPEAVTNAQFTRALGAALHRPTIVPVPRLALKAAMGGQMANEMLLSSARVLPRRLEELGFSFDEPDLRAALASVLD